MKNFIFGPVISRRLGYSLGIDFTEEKLCNMDCLYCECGITTQFSEKKDLKIKPKIILKEFKETLKSLKHLDFITFTGTGEPSLYSGLEKLYKGIKELLKESSFNPRYAILTNSTMFVDKKFYEFAKKMDIVLPSVDGISTSVINKINRPAQSIKWDNVLKKLINFQKEFTGELWIETFILEDINTSQEELNKFVAYFKKLNPHKIQINTIDRPPAYHVKKAKKETINKIYKFFKNELVHNGIGVEVIARAFELSRDAAIKYSEETLMSLLKRRPVPMYELLSIFGVKEDIFKKTLQKLIDKNLIQKKTLMNIDFFTVN